MGSVVGTGDRPAVQETNHRFCFLRAPPSPSVMPLGVSLFALLFKHPTERKQVYRDRIDRWTGNGRNEFKKNLAFALKEKLKIRPIIAMLDKSSDFQN